MFFPSLIESFGIPLIEAQAVRLPIYTSDRDFAHAVCNENTIYFDPLNINDILQKLDKEVPLDGEEFVIESWDSILKKMRSTFNQ